jgi:hypothetical protein
MKKFINILAVMAAVILLLPSFGSATLLYDVTTDFTVVAAPGFEALVNDGDVGATVRSVVNFTGTSYEYLYEVTNVDFVRTTFGGVSNIVSFSFPVLVPLETLIEPTGISASPGDVTSGDPRGEVITYTFAPTIGQGVITAQFGFTSIFAPSLTPSGENGSFMEDSFGHGIGQNYSGLGMALPDPNTNPVPEPGTLLLLGSGLLSAAGLRRWRKNKV